MARLEGRPGSYDVPSRGQVITKSGIVTCPDEDAHEFEAHGFTVVQWDGPTPPPAPEPAPEPAPARTEKDVIEDLNYMKGKAEEAKTENILSTATFGTNDHPNRSRVKARKG